MNPYLNISLPYFLNINPPPFTRSEIKKYFEKLPTGYSILAAFAAYRVLQDIDADVMFTGERDLIEKSWAYIHNRIGKNEFLNLRNAYRTEEAGTVPLGLRIANLVTTEGRINISVMVASVVSFANSDARLVYELFEESPGFGFFDLWWKKFIYLLNQEYFDLTASGFPLL